MRAIQQKILQLTPAATSVELTDIQPATDRFLFRTTPADDFQGAAVVLFAARTPRGLTDAGTPQSDGTDGGTTPISSTCSRLSIVYIDNPYGSSMAKVIADNFPKRGGEIASQNKIPLEAESSYQALAESIANPFESQNQGNCKPAMPVSPAYKNDRRVAFFRVSSLMPTSFRCEDWKPIPRMSRSHHTEAATLPQPWRKRGFSAKTATTRREGRKEQTNELGGKALSTFSVSMSRSDPLNLSFTLRLFASLR